ncbi:SAF domain-containing protein [Flexivirga sp. ID2601S]|uniref:SAF domain-containing protein n=1 Tax=Flexivirga aerilata TaxID=1656889 RepID=A0A849AU48_9MICO|nr:SAF domain-containing protein [Flexivirga aerilata]NNG40242.1 SAF domain-containing protein [Flexivirga aerilata]
MAQKGRAAAGAAAGEDQGLPRPVAGRLQRPSWRDARLVAGVLLILVAMLAGAAALRHYDDSVEVLEAARPLVPGQPITAGDVRAVKVRIDKGGATYFRAGAPLPSGEVLREVRPGELLPRSAVGAASSVRMKAVALPVDSSQSTNLVKGSIVDLWVSAKQKGAAGQESFDAPQRLLDRAVVSRVPQRTGGLTVATDSDAVHVLVLDDKVADVLAAVNSGAKVNLVPVAGSPLKGE